jgi:hypothetical protein
MMIPARRKKRRLPLITVRVAEPLRHLKPEHIPIKPKRARSKSATFKCTCPMRTAGWMEVVITALLYFPGVARWPRGSVASKQEESS